MSAVFFCIDVGRGYTPPLQSPDVAMPAKELTIDTIEAAARRLRGVVRHTPLLEAPLLNDRLGGRVLIKAECLQLTGSFKFRGAYSKLSQLEPAEREKGVVAYSSGNHAQGVAAAARLFGVPATIVMPSTAPEIKRRNTRAYGARVVEYDPATEVRERIGDRLSAETGAVLVRPYDDFEVMAGQGTAGLEAVRQCRELGVHPDQALCPCGGGGLVAGFSTAIRHYHPDVAVYAVEPTGFDDTARSLDAGERLANAPGGRSICDAIVTPMPGELTFEVNRSTLAGGLAVSDREVLEAMRCAFEFFKIVVEPGGAVALAALLSGRLEARGKTSIVVCSGGNVDPGIFARCLQ